MGDNIYLGDRNGVRTPMQWSADRNAGFSRANPQKLFLPIIIDPGYHYEAVNVESQQNNPHSLLWWMKHLIEQRKRYKAFGRGTLEFLRPSNRKVLAFYRRYEEETILVVANLSRFPQHVDLDLTDAKGMTPVEVFGRAEFPPIGDGFYNITLGALGFYWFSIEPRQTRAETVTGSPAAEEFPALVVEDWDHVFRGRTLAALLSRMQVFLKTRRWFQGRGRTVRSIDIEDQIPIPGSSATILLGEVRYVDGDPEVYVMPGSVASGDAVEPVRSKLHDVAVADLEGPNGSKGLLYSAVFEPAFCDALLGAIARRRRFRGRAGELIGTHTRALRRIWGDSHPDLTPSVPRADRTNSSITFGNRFQMKLYRRVEPGIHPEAEMGAFLTERGFPHAAAFTGSLEYRAPGTDPTTMASLFQYIPNQGHAWHYTLDSLGQFFEGALTRKEQDLPEPDGGRHALELSGTEFPQAAHEAIGTYFDSARLMGRRTAELHVALASDPDNPDFAPEPFTEHYRLALQHALLGLLAQTVQQLRGKISDLPESERPDAQTLLDQQDRLRAMLRAICETRIHSVRIRIHDDLKLNRLLHTGNDFVFIGFEGQAGRPLSERRIKRCPLRDVAALLGSLQAAADAVLDDRVPGVKVRPETASALESRAAYWFKWVSAAVLQGYVQAIDRKLPLAQSDSTLRALLDVFLIERSLDDIRQALQSETPSIRSPLHVLLRVLRTGPPAGKS
jgi:maltose alpha-D-glucosyltransferase/alpha-amylase